MSSGVTVIYGLDELEAAVGRVAGPCAWRTVTEETVLAFADLSGDHQWIHVDAERARAESPFGVPVAHGNLAFLLIDRMRDDVFRLDGVARAINYGWDRVRFPAPVRVGARGRASVTFVAVERTSAGHLLHQQWRLDVDDEARPACVADGLVLLT